MDDYVDTKRDGIPLSYLIEIQQYKHRTQDKYTNCKPVYAKGKVSYNDNDDKNHSKDNVWSHLRDTYFGFEKWDVIYFNLI